MSSITRPKTNIPIGYVANDRSKPIYVDPEWARYLLFSLFERIGGTSGTAEGGAGDPIAMAAFGQRQQRPNDVRVGDGLDIARDAAGPTLSLSTDSVRALSNDAQFVLAARIFAPR